MTRSAKDLTAQSIRLIRSAGQRAPDLANVVESGRNSISGAGSRVAVQASLLREQLRRAKDQTGAPPDSDRSAARIRAALQQVDWEQVKRLAARRARDVQESVRDLTADVDWSRVGTAAGKVALLVALAAATGELPDLDDDTADALGSALAGDVALPEADAVTVMAEVQHEVNMAYIDSLRS